MRRILVVAAVALLSVVALLAFTLRGGKFIGVTENTLPTYVKLCSDLPDPGHTPVAVSAGSDLQAIHEANCGAGCTLDLEADESACDYHVNLDVGSGNFLGPNDAPGAISPTGEVLIRAADPANPPTLCAIIDEPGPVIDLKEAHENDYFRLENIIITGRRADHSDFVFDVNGNGSLEERCPDVDENDICDDGTGFQVLAQGIDVGIQSPGNSKVCFENLVIRDVIGNGIRLVGVIDSTVEGGSVSDVGCTPDTCPNLTFPTDFSMPSRITSARGIDFASRSEDVAAVSVEVDGATKIGIQCLLTLGGCAVLNSVIRNVHNSGIAVLEAADADILRNRIEQVGLLLAMPAPGTDAGKGISMTAEGPTSARVGRNEISSTWGIGIQLSVKSTGTGDYIFSRNSVDSSCLGEDSPSIRPDIQYSSISGDPTSSILSNRNSMGGGCPVGMFVGVISESFTSTGDIILGAREQQSGLIKAGASGVDISRLFFEDDLVIEDGASGAVDDCLGTGTVLNASGGVTVSGCTEP